MHSLIVIKFAQTTVAVQVLSRERRQALFHGQYFDAEQ